MSTNPTGRYWRRFALLAGLLFAASLRAETVRVANFNLHNYLDTNRWVDGHYRMDYPKPEDEKDAVRKIIIAVNPDILALQEIGGPQHLEELRRDLKRDGLDFKYAECLVGPDEVRHIAVLSKVPFQAKGHLDLDFKYIDERFVIKRGLMELVFDKGDTQWSLFNLHLKSRWTNRDDDPQSDKRRTGEAQAARDYIKDAYPPEQHPRYLIVGDFNDTKTSAPVRRFLESGDTELTQLVDCRDSRSERWTFHYRREDRYERVDFILASPAMADAVKDAAIFDQQPTTSQASDHRLIYVDLEL